ncbi:MAG: DEAD/DEAH box helicase [Jaaginema sp. PMC 1079.18]|nr:DEAD/DEAH box helicase [Jaaginema sp. PMC 1080.18]MEC4849905.1 DEAD/DEAH box helicase [Jaaginema sp. PMC 1079.18]MEC4865982.1 DEAD/DEAH box helicase [Jaaginema sp. PMC 1078.18]
MKGNSSHSSFGLDVADLFPFELDEFQHQSIAALNDNQSVVVCVPTGSGKTLVGEYAIHRALARGKRVFYTTPLKALSNQKVRDFRQQFGEDQVGLLTGDASYNRDAPILVMTTEIFRNMLYGTPIGQVGTSLTEVETVVLDECHYMNDRQRGTVWEESIVYCPPNIQLVALSATIANANQLADWIDRVHGKTQLIQSDFRPVPLEFYFSSLKGLFPLLNPEQTAINPRLKKQDKRRRNPRQRLRREECPDIRLVVEQLRDRDYLPAIYFIFSRRGCDQAVKNMSDVLLVNDTEKAALKTRIDAFLERNPDAGRAGQVAPLYQGIAAHHAGILPAWKSLVEELFQAGLIKVVFATETLAAGINMPARTTVIAAISKRTDRGHRLLTASEFLQMAGRAGRRGMDAVGQVVTIQTPFEGAKDVASLALKPADPLVSQFTPNYGMVLNLLQTHSLAEAKNLLERSFAQYIAALRLEPERSAIAELTTELAKLDVELAAINPDQFRHYEKLRERIKEERRLLKTLAQQAETARKSTIAAALMGVEPGQVLYLQGKHIRTSEPIPALLYAQTPGRGQMPYLVCLTADNRWFVVAIADVVAISPETIALQKRETLVPPEDLPIKLGQYRKGDATTQAIAANIPANLEAVPQAAEVLEQQKRLEAVEAQLDNHPLQQWGKPSKLIKRHKRREELRSQLNERQTSYREHQTHHWREFLHLIEILQEFNALDRYNPTPLGQAAAAIRGDNELWLGLVLLSGKLDNLDPQDLAAAVYTLISEPPRPDSWTNYPPARKAATALEGLRGLRSELIKCQHRDRYKIALPVWLEPEVIEFTGIVEQWALGVKWTELCDNTSFDEGDLVRMLRRTVDFLSQIPHVPNVSEMLKNNARRAMYLMERFPVIELVE